MAGSQLHVVIFWEMLMWIFIGSQPNPQNILFIFYNINDQT